MRNIVLAAAVVLLTASSSAQEARKIYTDVDLRNLKHPVNSKRKVTEQELAGLRARQYQAIPIYAPGGIYGIPWTPANDRPQPTLPFYEYNRADPYFYGAQPLWQWTWPMYPYIEYPVFTPQPPRLPRRNR